MTRVPIAERIQEYINKKCIYFCMPGHKMGRGFNRDEIGKGILKNIITGDLTEVDGLDNLHKPEEVLREELELLRKIYSTEKSYFLVNGSTSGNMIMIFSAFEENDKIIVERNCHKSIMNGIILRKLKPVYVDPYNYDKYDTPLVPQEELIIEMMEKNEDAKGIILTYPNYFGICFDLEKIIIKAKELNMMVIIDSAHGAHFGFNARLPKSAVELGADVVVVSAHKTLPSLTQTAYLHVNNLELVEKVDRYFSMFSSTSPSYLFMQSMAYSRYYLEKYAEKDYHYLIDVCEYYKQKINDLNKFKVFNENRSYINIDRTRYTIIVPIGYSGKKLYDYLLYNNIQPEMSNHRCVVLILSYFNTKEEFEKLYEVLRNCNMENIKDDSYSFKMQEIKPIVKFLPHEAINMKKVSMNVVECEGEICGEEIIPYPPGIPLLNPGELITKEAIEYIQFCLKNNIQIFGVDRDKILILENN
ncbi:aminotransferase class I/II-fold pyridoxal phosphate-dependent enzyme [Oceanirhabdus sp. W0125-5]|uniref:aminotransferase class I/II-fold pyridoxal phosphate-dependent enzyme n=1 Tax=Oceanirhabdus sp. W0125-5 TaxID=2999116 RepID=UPI0022F31E35|nr:aminotransferase class I/II-fold pyridoxal phosphate-dependent enzyme [Oceanirhabdus sp. W0125-5]WBW97496.1 aminotransferase class I/II-fold pyridoxal phosphate-dependent enzyme [Oceanirhabdus sp. W0125-5]